jgi:nucleoside-diphosphate-sugar epimerase
MSQRVLIVTGAAGFLGSAITVALSRQHKITAIDVRDPGDRLREATPGVTWERADIADAEGVASVFRDTQRRHGRIDFLVHFAAFYHFGTDWRPEYERTNVRGTATLLQAATDHGVERVIFASSIAAMEPPPAGHRLTHETPTSDFIPYARSKTLGEDLVAAGRDELPGIVLRIGGAFSDWCELPPLYSLIRMWAAPWPWSRLVPGRGESGIPYIHRQDVARIVGRCIERHHALAPFEVLLASSEGAVSHQELFPVIRRTLRRRGSWRPIFISPRLAKLGLTMQLALGAVVGRRLYERPWMLDFVDRPWVADVRHTHTRLGWRCSPGMGIGDRLPLILDRFKTDRRRWEERNRRRNRGQYLWRGDDRVLAG